MNTSYQPPSTVAALVITAIMVALASLAMYAIGKASTADMEFAARCQAQHGQVVTGRGIQLCVSPDGRILESR